MSGMARLANAWPFNAAHGAPIHGAPAFPFLLNCHEPTPSPLRTPVDLRSADQFMTTLDCYANRWIRFRYLVNAANARKINRVYGAGLVLRGGVFYFMVTAVLAVLGIPR
ncbi:hypothetical protein [Sulfuricaulis sp.]